MISYQSDAASLRELGEQSRQAYSAVAPFPHIVIDDFFDSRILDGVLTEVNAVDRSRWDPADQMHTTLFYISRPHKVRLRVWRMIRGFILDLIPPIIRKSLRAAKRLLKGEKLSELWS